MKAENNSKPPYGSVSRLRQALNLLATHNFSQIGTEEFINRGYSTTDAFQTVAALKFLGIINQDGQRTEKMTNLQLKGEERTKAMEEIVKMAYSKLFETVQEPNKLGKDELFNDFVSVYQLSTRLATTAVPNFLWLCSEAGLEIVEPMEVKEVRSSMKPHISSKKPIQPAQYSTPPLLNSLGKEEQIIDIGIFKLVIPKSDKIIEALMNGEFKTVKDEIKKLSDKFTISETSEKETEG